MKGYFSEFDRIKQMITREQGSISGIPMLSNLTFIRIPTPTGAFYISDTPVNEAAWYNVVSNGIGLILTNLLNKTLIGTLPKVRINKEEVEAFLSRFNTLTESVRIGLPTEEQWMEAAAHFPDQQTGWEQLSRAVWYKRTMPNGKRRQPVRMKDPNANGLYDMIGNVWEWTCTPDKYDSWSYVVLGGSWRSTTETCMHNYRRTYDYMVRDNRTGFRIILEKK